MNCAPSTTFKFQYSTVFSLVFTVCSLHLQETGALATSASVVQADPSVREGEDWKHKVYQEGVEHTKVSHV